MLELACALAIAAIVAAMSYPSWTGFLVTQRVKATAGDVASTLARARFEALTRNQPVKVVPADGDWNRGWSIVLAEDERVLDATPAPDPTLRVDGTAGEVAFGWTGRLTENAADVRIRVAAREPEGEAHQRCVRLDPAGRVYVVPGACG